MELIVRASVTVKSSVRNLVLKDAATQVPPCPLLALRDPPSCPLTPVLPPPQIPVTIYLDPSVAGARAVAWWIILLAVLAGILLLALLVAVLWKVSGGYGIPPTPPWRHPAPCPGHSRWCLGGVSVPGPLPGQRLSLPCSIPTPSVVSSGAVPTTRPTPPATTGRTWRCSPPRRRSHRGNGPACPGRARVCCAVLCWRVMCGVQRDVPMGCAWAPCPGGGAPGKVSVQPLRSLLPALTPLLFLPPSWAFSNGRGPGRPQCRGTRQSRSHASCASRSPRAPLCGRTGSRTGAWAAAATPPSQPRPPSPGRGQHGPGGGGLRVAEGALQASTPGQNWPRWRGVLAPTMTGTLLRWGVQPHCWEMAMNGNKGDLRPAC